MPTRIADDLSQRKNGRINGPSLGHHLGKRQYGSSGGHNFGCSTAVGAEQPSGT
jgi:hypothetical protein